MLAGVLITMELDLEVELSGFDSDEKTENVDEKSQNKTRLVFPPVHTD